jgi:hypothetical protein
MIGGIWGGRGRLDEGEHAECSLEQGPFDGQKRPPKTKELWAIRVRLRLEHERGTSIFSISKLRDVISSGPSPPAHQWPSRGY